MDMARFETASRLAAGVGGASEQRIEETRAALRELGLHDHVSMEDNENVL
jgi:hypothetical protein